MTTTTLDWTSTEVSDGLPIIAPTKARVHELLDYRGWDPAAVIGAVPPRNGLLTYEVAAANAVMTGCTPEQFLLVTEALAAMLEPAFNLYAIQATTHPVGPTIIFSGPAATDAGVTSGQGCFGPGNAGNVRVGRAVRLILQNVGGARAGGLDRATFGTPHKSSMVFAEKGVESDGVNWTTRAAEFAGDGANVVTVVATEGPHEVNDHRSFTAHDLLRQIAFSLANVGTNDALFFPDSTPVVVLGPEHARTIAGDGWSRQDAREYIARHARVPLRHWSRVNIDGHFAEKWPSLYTGADDFTDVPVVTADELVLVVAGGEGKHSMISPSYGVSKTVSRVFE
ncbi:hypothetical protein [Nocardioides sp. WS12]|uniref:hypothetical protein n=1 Tax=Nocardioides sp. WS12 TaxID=2486272 RepID=UPI0015F972BC|nr:hypothetical protein [Nocardioides sp. WS12]